MSASAWAFDHVSQRLVQRQPPPLPKTAVDACADETTARQLGRQGDLRRHFAKPFFSLPPRWAVAWEQSQRQAAAVEDPSRPAQSAVALWRRAAVAHGFYWFGLFGFFEHPIGFMADPRHLRLEVAFPSSASAGAKYRGAVVVLTASNVPLVVDDANASDAVATAPATLSLSIAVRQPLQIAATSYVVTIMAEFRYHGQRYALLQGQVDAANRRLLMHDCEWPNVDAIATWPDTGARRWLDDMFTALTSNGLFPADAQAQPVFFLRPIIV